MKEHVRRIHFKLMVGKQARHLGLATSVILGNFETTLGNLQVNKTFNSLHFSDDVMYFMLMRGTAGFSVTWGGGVVLTHPHPQLTTPLNTD